MRELGISSRSLAQKISTPTKTLTHTTIWAWTKNLEGTPPKATYTPEVNRKLALALNLKPEDLAYAFEESRRHLTIADSASAQLGLLSVLRKLFADSKQETWSSSEIVALIDAISRR